MRTNARVREWDQVRVVGIGVKSESYDPTATEVALLRVSPMLYATWDDPTLLATEDAANL